MGISTKDIVPLSQARANLSELAEQVKAGREKIITKDGLFSRIRRARSKPRMR